jgi:hypothetical protein
MLVRLSRYIQLSYLVLASTARVSTAFYSPLPRTTFISSKRLFATSTTTIMPNTILARVTPDNVSLEIKDPVDAMALEQAKAILSELRPDNAPKVDATKLVEVGIRLGDLKEGAPLIISKEACKAAFEGLTDTERTALVNIYDRVKTFAEAQRKAVVDMEIDIPGGKAGHTVSPCKGTFIIHTMANTFLIMHSAIYSLDGHYIQTDSCWLLCPRWSIPSPLLRHYDCRHGSCRWMSNCRVGQSSSSPHYPRGSSHCRC